MRCDVCQEQITESDNGIALGRIIGVASNGKSYSTSQPTYFHIRCEKEGRRLDNKKTMKCLKVNEWT